MSVPFIPTRNSTAGSTAAPTTSQLTTLGQCAINTYTGSFYMRKEDNTISEIVGDRLSGFRNRIINGNMAIDQRNAGTAVTLNSTSLTYTADRWAFGWVGSAAVATATRASGQLPLSRYTEAVVVTTSSTPSGNQTYNFQQRIEGANISDLQWGTANAAPVTLSFRVQSSIAGTFSGSIQNGAQTRSYPFSYTISANTPTSVAVTIPGDTSGSYAFDNSAGIIVAFDLGGAGTSRGTANVWATAGYFGVTGAVNLVANVSATWSISEIQLEKGLVPTPFEVRSYGTELALCQRYYIQDNFSTTQGVGPVGFADSTTVSLHSYYSKVTMRSAPTFSYTGAFEIRRSGGVASSVSAITQSLFATNMSRLAVTSSSLTAGQGVLLEAESGTPTLNFSAEL